MDRPASPPASRIVAISPDDGSAIDLKNPLLAAVLSWLVPGLGQIYQGRTFKGLVMLVAIGTAVVTGLSLSEGRAAYFQWRQGPSRQTRWAFLGQAGIGGLAIPMMVQERLLGGTGKQPLLALPWLAPPLVRGQQVSDAYARRLIDGDPDIADTDFEAGRGGRSYKGDQLSLWQRRLGRFFDLGTLYLVLAGLFNFLVVYDAWSGPMRPNADDDEAEPEPKRPAAPVADRKRHR